MSTSNYHHLKNKWLKKHKVFNKKLIAKHKDISSHLKQHVIGGLMLASAPFLSITTASTQLHPLPVPAPVQQTHLTTEQLIETLREKLPTEVRLLTNDEEKDISGFLSSSFHAKVSAELNGMRLNRSYGLIGQEQHLKRFPGDSIDTHFESSDEANLYARQGIAPGLGAWGYFTRSSSDLSTEDMQREKYYIAVPTFLSPNWNQRVGEYGIFYKYRKMLVVNPENGKAVIADIADAGPAEWTGKHLGGSPEVMRYLERVDGSKRGPVLYFFLDESSGTIPLGPITS